MAMYVLVSSALLFSEAIKLINGVIFIECESNKVISEFSPANFIDQQELERKKFIDTFHFKLFQFSKMYSLVHTETSLEVF